MSHLLESFSHADITDDGKSAKKRHSRSKQTSLGEDQDGQFESIPRHVHRRKHRHSSKSRCMSKNKSLSYDIEDNNDYSISSPKHKHRRCKSSKGVVRFSDNLVKIEPPTEFGPMATHDEILTQLEKYKTKCSKLEKNYKDIKARNLDLEITVNQREEEYKELNTHYEKLHKHTQFLDQEKISNQSTINALSAENSQLNKDINLLKILVYKLNVELERYQDKIRLLNQRSDHENNLIAANEAVTNEDNFTTNNKQIFEAWGRVNTHALSPLLEAYKENIEEKAELIKKFKQDIDEFSGRCKEIVSENEELRKDLDYYKSQTEKLDTEMKTLLDDVALVKEENDILNKQASLQKQKLHEIHSIYEKKVESMSQDNNRVYNDYVNCRTELSNLEGKYEILNEGYEKLKKNSERTMPVSVHSDAIEECKRLFEELKTQYEMEKKKLLSQLKRMEESNPEYEKMIATLTAERDHLRYLTRNLEKNFKKVQHKLENHQSVLFSLQISKDSMKRQLTKTTQYCQDLVTQQEKLKAENQELLILLDKKSKENECIQHIGDNIAAKMGALKGQLKDVQKGAKEQLETVEKHIKIQEMGAGQMKSEYEKEIQRLKCLIKEKENVIGKLQKEKYATQDNLELVWKAVSSEEQKVKNILKNRKNHI